MGSFSSPASVIAVRGLLTDVPHNVLLMLIFAGLALLLLLPPVVEKGLRQCGRIEANFRGERIVQSYGLVIVLWSGVMLGIAAFLLTAFRPMLLLWLLIVTGYGALGFVDDTWGTKQIKGLRGHFHAAFRERRITTGFLKAVGGALLALFAGWRLQPDNLPLALLAAALMALSANAINLLDLRPGRAGGVFLFLALLLLAGVWLVGGGVSPLLFVLLPALVVWRRDARAQVMMGDTGSNPLGASLGLALVSSSISLPLRLSALALLVALHVLAERVSLTKIIEQKSFLRRLDRLTGVR